MELWIRSQDKIKLVNNCNLYISDAIKDEYVIEDLSNNYLKLGSYKTKERALEVLDEIQNILFYKKMSEDNISTFSKIITEKYDEKTKNKIYMSTAVYEMPEE